MKTVKEIRELSRGHFAVIFDDGEKVTCGLNIRADFSLYEGREMDENEYSRLSSALTKSACRERTMRILSAGSLSTRELYERLIQKGETEQNAADSVAYAISLHFLDDAEYARNLVLKAARKGYGRRRAADELYRHKVPRELWDDALNEFPEEDDRLSGLVASALRNEDPSDPSVIKRVSAKLMRRGFGWSEIKAAINEYSENAECSSIYDDYD